MLEYLDSMIFTRIKYQFPASIKSKYPELLFTTDDNRTKNTTNFPIVYFKSLGGMENNRSKDLERTYINGVVATYQIEVSDNVTQERAKTVMDEVVKIMKGMMFDVTTMPLPSDYNGVYRYVARFRRAIDDNDVL